jgi:hypothetical protein
LFCFSGYAALTDDDKKAMQARIQALEDKKPSGSATKKKTPTKSSDVKPKTQTVLTKKRDPAIKSPEKVKSADSGVKDEHDVFIESR